MKFLPKSRRRHNSDDQTSKETKIFQNCQMILSETILRLVTLLTLVSCFDFSKKRREIECSRCLVSRVRGFDFQWRMEAQTRLNSFLLIALHMSRVLHPSFFSQVHMVNTHVFSIGATFLMHFKDISNTAKVHTYRIVYNKTITGSPFLSLVCTVHKE